MPLFQEKQPVIKRKFEEISNEKENNIIKEIQKPSIELFKSIFENDSD